MVGNFTRLAQFYLNSEKVYEGTIRFGFSTDTYDAEGEPTSAPKAISLQKEELEIAADHFRRNTFTPVLRARRRCSAYGPARATLSASFFCGARHIASGVNARARFRAASAASRFRGLECADNTSHTKRVNGS